MIRLLQIGFGYIGRRRTGLIAAHPSIDLVGLADINPEQLVQARDVVPEHCRLLTDYQEALSLLKPVAVIVSTPNHLHAPMTLDALKSGAHVLCEKPLAINAAMVEHCVKYAHQENLVLKVGSNHRFWRGVDIILNEIGRGSIGRITGINGEIGCRFPDIRSEWYREKQYSGGGTLIDNGPHLIDVVNKILHLDQDTVQKVQCATSRASLEWGVEDTAIGKLGTRRGRLVEVISTWADGDYHMNLDIQGTDGCLKLTGFNNLQLQTKTNDKSFRLDDVPSLESWERDVQSFVDAIILGAYPESSGDDALEYMRVIDAMYQSADFPDQRTQPIVEVAPGPAGSRLKRR